VTRTFCRWRWPSGLRHIDESCTHTACGPFSCKCDTRCWDCGGHCCRSGRCWLQGHKPGRRWNCGAATDSRWLQFAQFLHRRARPKIWCQPHSAA
jgi:hypothetical protein